MKPSVYKYELPFTDIEYVLMPKGAKVLSAINQNEKIVLYALVDTEEEILEGKKFLIAGTGHEIKVSNVTFIDTISFASGQLIFHIFQIN